MSDVERILVPTDLSAAADDALRYAHDRALATSARLAVCYVHPARFGIDSLFRPRTEAALRDAAAVDARLRELLAERVATCMPSARVDLFIEQGRAHVGIVRRAEAWAADLIVIGSYGRAGLPRLQLGSVAEQVVRYAHCSVLTVRPTPNVGPVVVGTDLSDPALPAITFGAAEARRRGARLVVVHSVEYASLDEPLRATATQALRRALRRSGADGDTVVGEGPAADAIVRCATDVEAALVVMGTRGRAGIVRIALGSVAERVTRAAPCPVVVVRAVR